MNPSPAQDISRHVPRLYRVAMRLVADADTAHDVVQEACVKALANMADFNAHCSLATWLHRIIVNCALSNGRSEQRRQRAYATAGETVRARQGGEESSPAAIAEASESSALAWELVERLPEDCRSAFVLTQLDGYSYDEAAQIEGQPRGTMASRVFRAKKILQEQMNARIDERAKQ